MGTVPTIGHIKVGKEEMPVCVTLLWAFLNGHCVCFYQGTSMVVHHEWVDKWVTKAVKDASGKSPGHCDAMNFHNCVHELGLTYDHKKVQFLDP